MGGWLHKQLYRLLQNKLYTEKALRLESFNIGLPACPTLPAPAEIGFDAAAACSEVASREHVCCGVRRAACVVRRAPALPRARAPRRRGGRGERTEGLRATAK